MKTFQKIAIPISLGIIGLLFLNSCSVGIPDGATAVKNFDSDKYLGKWYEIARFPHSFEKNLVGVTATYSLRDDGKIKVIKGTVTWNPQIKTGIIKNPSTGIFQIYIENPVAEMNVMVVNVEGKVIYESKINESKNII